MNSHKPLRRAAVTDDAVDWVRRETRAHAHTRKTQNIHNIIHTHTHTQREREREANETLRIYALGDAYLCLHTHTYDVFMNRLLVVIIVAA